MSSDARGIEPQTIRDNVANELSKYRSRRRQGYASVHVLLLSWEASDDTFGEDVRGITRVFRDSFNYVVLPYKIPSKDSQRRLNLHVAQFLSQYGSEDNLIVVYYGGHGAPSALHRSECIWAAFLEGDPTLDWSAIQPQFLSADCDVVILLDCCYAGQAVRGRTAHRVELLASTDKDQFTPIGNQKYPSFTKVLMNEMERMLKDHGAVTIPSLEKSMASAKSGLVKQPFYVPLSDQDPNNVVTAICLTRWERINNVGSRSVAIDSPTERAFFELRLRLTHPNHLDLTQGLVNWVTKNSPKFIDDIEVIDDVISDARAATHLAHQLIQPESSDKPSQPHPFLPAPAQQKAIQLLKDLNQVILTPTLKAVGDIEAVEVFRDIKEKSEKVSEFIKDCLTSLDGESCKMLRRQELSSSDLRDQISMRLTLLQDDPHQNQIRVSFKNLASSPQRIRIGQIESSRVVLVDYFSYDATKKDGKARASKQVAKVSMLLSQPKDPSFRTLPGLGFTHDTIHGSRFGLVYDLPNRRSDLHFCLLSDVIKGTKVVPLDIRYRLALALCESVMRLHSIGWFHKGIKSENVIIFSSNPLASDGLLDKSPEDLEHPYLIGFDCSRPEDAETWVTEDFRPAVNIYRHPERWGQPSRFQRHHDLYALGVLLIEIGYWKVLTSMLRGGLDDVKGREIVRDSMIEMTTPAGRVSHAAGSGYANAAYNCIVSADLSHHQDWEYNNIVRKDIWAYLKACCSSRRED